MLRNSWGNVGALCCDGYDCCGDSRAVMGLFGGVDDFCGNGRAAMGLFGGVDD